MPLYLPPDVPEMLGKMQGFPTHLGIPKTELEPPDQSPNQQRNLEGPLKK